MASHLFSSSPHGIRAERIVVEATVAPGIPSFIIVGLPDTAIQEARERIRSALRTIGLPLPQSRVTVNLAPGHLKKIGTAFDLPIAIAILLSSGAISVLRPLDRLFLGELSLDGMLCPVSGVLPSVLLAKSLGIAELFVPFGNAAEAALVGYSPVYAPGSLQEVILHLSGASPLLPIPHQPLSSVSPSPYSSDLAHIRGQTQAKRALEIAAAGGHNILFNGPPGSGKSLLAKTFPSILPPMTEEEILEVTSIYSCLGQTSPDRPLIITRPFRSPHHHISPTALVGGGGVPRPGEISLAHHGILFLDELPEFSRCTLEHLRQPLEDGFVTISRAYGSYTFPAQCSLIATQNPCPCGYATDTQRHCTCTAATILQYRKKISGPLLDRLDMVIEVPRVPADELFSSQIPESSACVRSRVVRAQSLRYERTSLLQRSMASQKLLIQATNTFHLSARAVSRILKVSQTIADLEERPFIEEHHIAEALQFRQAAPISTSSYA